MKKFILFSLLLICLCPLSLCGNLSFAENGSSIYAKIEKNNVFLYSSPSLEEDNKLFELPNSYFVRLIEQTDNNFYYCAYKDVFGYVSKSDVVAMDGTPVNPYVEANFRIYALEGIGLYSSPRLSNDLLKTNIPYLTDNLTFYGTRSGQSIPDKSSLWIYCKYSFDTTTYGYVYSVFCDKLPSISTNNERFEIIEQPFLNSSNSPKELTSVAMGFIIVGVSLPCLIVLLLLVKPSLQTEGGQKFKLKRRKHKDYFEFDENDLT